MHQPSSRLSGENSTLFWLLIFFPLTVHYTPLVSHWKHSAIREHNLLWNLYHVEHCFCFWTVMLGTVSKEAGQHPDWERSIVKNESSYRRRKRVKWREFAVRFRWSIMLIARIIIRVGSARCKCIAPQIQIVSELRIRYLNSLYVKRNTSILLPTE